MPAGPGRGARPDRPTTASCATTLLRRRPATTLLAVLADLPVHPQRPDRHLRLRARLRLLPADGGPDGRQRLHAGRLPGALRRARPGRRARRLADDPWRDRALRHHPGRRGGLPHRLARWPSRASGPGWTPPPRPGARGGAGDGRGGGHAVLRRPAGRLRPPADPGRPGPLRHRRGHAAWSGWPTSTLPRRGEGARRR